MNILPRRSRAVLAGCLVLAGVLFVLLADAIPGRADVGVRPVLPGGSSIQPEDETPIQMAAETVVINVRAAREADNAAIRLNPKAYGLDLYPVWFPAVADVEADFTMQNPTGEAVSMTAWFPLASALKNADWNLNPDEIVPRIQSFRVSISGNEVDYQVSELPNPKGAGKPPLPWASFAVNFPANGEIIIHVSYLLPLQQAIKGNELALYYIFQTGAGWAGPIGQAELILNLPYPASAGTIAGIAPGSLQVPYMMATRVGALPPGAVMEGNQARWTWKDWEPDAQDDFAVWVMAPGNWEKLQSARTAVQANPQDGLAWLDLAKIYHGLSTHSRNSPSIFSASYQPSGVEAYRAAAGLLPEHPAPHTGLALLTLAPYLADRKVPADVMQTVLAEYQIAKELEAKNPGLAEDAGLSSWLVDDIFNDYFYNLATPTLDAAIWTAEAAIWRATATLQAASWTAEARISVATSTAEARISAATATAYVASRQKPSATPTPQPSSTALPQSQPTVLPTIAPTDAPAGSQTVAYILGFGIASLVILGYWLLKRKQGVNGRK